MIRGVRKDGTIEAGGVFTPIERPRILERITEAAAQRIVLIIAPAGYGKSVALHQFLGASTLMKVLYTLRPEHSGLLGFLRGLADALQGASPQARATLAGAYERNAGSHTPGGDLALWMESHLDCFSGIIAIDELHVAQEDREVTRFLSALIERTKSRVQWILCSRGTRGLPIGTWLAYGDSALAIDEFDLRFTVGEAGALARALRLRVREGELSELLAVTDGWATGMSFALRSATRSVDLRGAASRTREMVYTYLAEQVYSTLGNDEREFLKSSVLLESIEIDVMIAAGFDRAAALLEELRHRVAFIHADADGNYRCHDLFRDFVLHEIQRNGANAVAVERRRLGAVLEGLERFPAALRMYCTAHASDAITRVLRTHGFDLLAKGHADAVSSALSTIDASGVGVSPIVIALRGVLDLIGGKYDEGERQIERALANNLGAKLHAELTLRLAIAHLNRGTDAVALLEGLIAGERVPLAARIEARALLAVVCARTREFEQARVCIEAVKARLGRIRDDELRAKLLLRIGLATFELGDADSAKSLLSSAQELTGRGKLWSLDARTNIILSNLAWYAENDLSGAERFALLALQAASKAGDQFDRRTPLLSLLGIATLRGDSARAAQIEEQVSELLTDDAEQSALLVESQAHRAAWESHFDAARRLFGSILQRQVHQHDRCAVEAFYVLCSALNGTPAESSDAMAVVQSIARSAEETPHVGQLYFELSRLICALAAVVSGRQTFALRILKYPGLCAESAATSLRSCVEELARSTKSPEYRIADLSQHLANLRAFGLGCYAHYVVIAKRYVESARITQKPPELTPSELSALRSVAAGLTPKQIANETGRSLLTVQTHIKNAIAKLDAHGAAGAVATARRRGILTR